MSGRRCTNWLRARQVDGEAELAAAIRAGLGTYFHPVGTCRMGPATNPMAVVDAKRRCTASRACP